MRTTNSHEALSILRTQPIDLFTQDIMRPDIDGWTVCKIMKADETLRDIPILIASANRGGPRIVGVGYADGYIAKPFRPIELLDAVEDILRRRSKPLAAEEARACTRSRWKR